MDLYAEDAEITTTARVKLHIQGVALNARQRNQQQQVQFFTIVNSLFIKLSTLPTMFAKERKISPHMNLRGVFLSGK